jgi:Zn-dependent protease with chaperone function
VLALSSQLVRDFEGAALKFVVGHEFGHALFQHHGYPRPGDTNSKSEAAYLFDLCRSAEFSADRVGLAVAGDSDAAQGA